MKYRSKISEILLVYMPAMFYFLALNSGSVFASYQYRSRFCVSRFIPVMLTGVCMAHRTTCLIPTCKNTCGGKNTKTTFLEIFFIGYHFITARKVSSAISSLNVCEKTFEKSRNTKPIPVTRYTDISLPEIIPTGV